MVQVNDKLQAMGRELAGLGPPGIRIARTLHGVAHDMKSPLAAFGMELYMARQGIERLAAAATADDLVALRRELGELSAICENLENAAASATRLTSAVAAAVSALAGVDDDATG